MKNIYHNKILFIPHRSIVSTMCFCERTIIEMQSPNVFQLETIAESGRWCEGKERNWEMHIGRPANLKWVRFPKSTKKMEFKIFCKKGVLTERGWIKVEWGSSEKRGFLDIISWVKSVLSPLKLELLFFVTLPYLEVLFVAIMTFLTTRYFHIASYFLLLLSLTNDQTHVPATFSW